MEVKPYKEITPEFSVFKIRGRDGYVLEVNGEVHQQIHRTVKDAHRAASFYAKTEGWDNAGLTEVFGRNRQFVMGPRGGWVKFKGEA